MAKEESRWTTGGNDVLSFYSRRLSYIGSKQVCTGSVKAMTLLSVTTFFLVRLSIFGQHNFILYKTE
jgi:hypothetical protein